MSKTRHKTGFLSIGMRNFFRISSVGILILGITACGGGSGGDDDVVVAPPKGEITGTGFGGTTAVGAAIADAPIIIKSLSGRSITTTSDANGNFNSPELKEANANTALGPYLIGVDRGNGQYLYSIAHTDNATSIDNDSVNIAVNIHPFTDLIIRNWFAIEGIDIDAQITGDQAISRLPTNAQINAISDEILGIFSGALEANNVATDTNLLSSAFAIGDSFDIFLDNSSVVISNVINIIVADPSSQVQVNIINELDINTDFTNANDGAPTTPQDLRVLTVGADEAVLVWQPSSDDKGVAGYNIYRDNVLIATTPYPVFIDSNLTAGTVYIYRVEAFDGRNQTSDLTTRVDILLNQEDIQAPSSPTNLTAQTLGGPVSLAWTQADIADVYGFRVLRGARNNVTNQYAIVTSTSFTDFAPPAASEYCYVIVAFDGAGNDSAATAEQCIGGTNTPDASSISFSSANYSVEESLSSVTITVERAGDISDAVSIDYAASAGSATADDDFVETSGTLNWLAMDAEAKTFTVQINNTAAIETDETVLLMLSNPSSNTALGSASEATLTITDAPQIACIDLQETDITEDTTLDEPCYNVNSSIAISNAAVLTIAPGTQLIFASGTQLEAEADGQLIAEGTAQEPIVMTGALSASGYWNGIEIRSAAESILDYVVVEYGGGNSFNEANVGVSFDGRLRLTNSVIRSSASYGVAATASNARLTEFSGNTVTLNELSPLFILANNVGVIAANNALSGNITSVGGDRDYVLVGNGVTAATITTNQTWNSLDVEYRMPSNATNIDSELTLAPGVQMVFRSGGQLNVRASGSLVAIGTPEQVITFTGLQQTPGFWRGIQFTFNGNDNRLDNAVVEYGGGGSNTDANVGVVGNNARLSITNTILRSSANYGFDFGSDITLVMDNVTMVDNRRPGILDFDDAGKLSDNSLYIGNTDDRIILRSSTLSTEQTIKNLGLPYYAVATAQMAVSSALTIEPGVEVQFNAGGGFNVNAQGTFIAQGTPTEMITFTGEQQTKGYWNGFQFTFSNNPNVLDYTIVEYGGAASGNTEALVGFFGDVGRENRGSVTNSILRGSLTNGIELGLGTSGEFAEGNAFEDIDGLNILDPR